MFDHGFGAIFGVDIADGDDVGLFGGPLHSRPPFSSRSDNADSESFGLDDARNCGVCFGGGGCQRGGAGDGNGSCGTGFEKVATGELVRHRCAEQFNPNLVRMMMVFVMISEVVFAEVSSEVSPDGMDVICVVLGVVEFDQK